MNSGNKLLKKSLHFSELLWKVVRFVIIFGLAFLIIKPFVVKILMATMSPDDLLDNSVRMIPKHPNTYYWKQALEGMNLSETLPMTAIMTALSTAINLVVSAMVGYGLARFNFRGRKLAFFTVILILLVPSQTISISEYLGFKFFLGTGINLIDTTIPLYIKAFTGLGFKEGLYIYLMMSFFKGLPQSLEEAAYIDGAGPIRTFLQVIIPNARSIIITVFMFSFCWQWTDFGYANTYFTSLKVLATAIPAIYIRVGLTPDMLGTYITQNAACILILVPLIIIFAIGQRYLVNSLTRSGIAN